MRPKSIVYFERLYLGSLAFGLLSTALFWNQTMAAATNAAAAAFGPTTIYVIAGGAIAFATAINIALWYFAARRRANLARWIIAVLAVWSAVGWLLSLPQVTTGMISPFGLLRRAVVVGLGLAAVVMLFRADAKAWFKGDLVDPEVFS